MKRVVFTETRSLGRCLLSSAASKSHLPTDIAIPLAIERSPTDILKALSSTVGVDPTAPHFSFIDDPAMIPSTNRSKQIYFAAKNMGRRSARLLAEEWPTLFAFDRDQPELPAFRPAKAAELIEKEALTDELSKTMVQVDLEDKFYFNYLSCYIDSSHSIEDITAKYVSLVPRLVGGNRQIVKKIAEKLKIQPHWPLLRRIVEDGITSRFVADHKSSTIIRNSLIDFPYQNLSPTEREEFRELIQRLVDIWVELSNFTDELSKRLQVKFSPKGISECAVLLQRVGEAERSYKMLEQLLDTENSYGENATIIAAGHARPSAMAELFELALHEKDVYRASICLEVMSQYTSKIKLDPLARRIHAECKLTEGQTRIINGFVRLRPE